ncbi:MAG: hypothetical protein N3A63_01925 [Bacteroidetes bacterium]|nr:hypothetical protein [Bacteroidota bacterium]
MQVIVSSVPSKRIKCRGVWFFLYILSITAVAQSLNNPLDRLVKEGIHLILLQQYHEALNHFKKVTHLAPEHPYGYLYQVATLQAMAIDLETPIDEHLFDSLLVRAQQLAERYPQPWQEFFCGLVDGYRAYYAADQGRWLQAVRYGSSSAQYFEKVLQADSTFYEAYVGVGTYYFWKSEKTQFLTWLPFISDDRMKGIQMLTIASERAEYNRFSAMSSLITIYLELKEYSKAETWARRALQQYPRNRVFLWGLATAYDRAGKLEEAVQWYSTLLQEILSSQQAHPYNEIVCRLNLSKAKLRLNDTVGVNNHLKTVLSYKNHPFPSKIKSRVQEKFNIAADLLGKLDKGK